MITFGNDSLINSSGYVNSLTDSGLAISGDNPVLIVIVASRDLSFITGITHNGVALTKQAQSFNSNVCGVDIWTLESPDVGSFDIVLSSSGWKLFSMYSFYLNGAAQSGAIEAVNDTNTGWSDAPSNSITTLTDGSWVVDGINLQSTKTITANSGQTERNNSDHSDSNLGQFGISTEEKATAGAETQGWSWTGGDNWAHALIAVKPSLEINYKPQIITIN